MLEEILSVSGKTGLFKLVSKGKNMFIVESLLTHKRMPVYLRDKVTSLDKIAIYTESNEISLSLIFDKINEKEKGHEINSKILNADNEVLNNYFKMILHDYDRRRVYPSHIRKILSWYNLLLKEKSINFVESNEENEVSKENE